ncbi:MAG: LysR substrate-binding domain-containing protein, partial [Marinibacterium sp.]|nr:LysR substrate-binding domain-containing protein [Marinibacterium sp.]
RHTPGQDVNQVAQDALFGDRADVDLYIRYGPEHRAGVTQTPLYRDRLVPVASPDLAQGLVGSDLATLAQQRLIFLESQDRSWTTWADWFRALGYDGPIRDGVRVNRYSVALQMAQDGAGLALGWQRLIRPMLETGQLVPVGDHHLMAPHQFYLVGRSNMSDGAQALRSWILDELRSGSV